MIKIQLVELPPVRTDGGVNVPTETWMRITTQWKYADMLLANQIWTYILWQASSGRTEPFSADDLQRETLPLADKKRSRGAPKPFTNAEVEECMAHLVEFGLMKFANTH